MKNYYKILNVRPTATDDEIKRSYRVLAKQYHPDVNPGNASAADRFADINEAHDVLSDPKRRADYDKKLKEASAPKPRPEDIIARQRAAAQAAARQAAMRNNMTGAGSMSGMSSAHQAAAQRGSSIDPSLTVAQRAVAQAAAVQAQAAAAQAAAQAQAQNMAKQYQAQLSAVEKQAFASGRERGKLDAKIASDREINALNAEIRSLRTENRNLQDKLTDIELDRSDLEQELFNRDRELTQEKARADDLEKELFELRRRAASKPSGKSTSDYNALVEMLNEANARALQMERERDQAELKSQAQLELQQDKRRQLVDHIETLNAKIRELADEIEALRTENEQWRQYVKSEDFLSEAEARLADWDKKQKADKKLAKSTLYGALGTLIWATDEEIAASFDKLVKRYQTKDDEESAEKLKKIREAYKTLSVPEQRAAYNESIGITQERIEQERKAIEENKKIEEEYRSQLESKEFWEQFDELTFNAQTGDAESQNSLGEMYYYGDEIEQDIEQAVYWFKEAAKQKHPEAMYNLGVCFCNGEGVEKNYATGLGFIRQASKLGSRAAEQYLHDADN